jgi:hypothetical protein
MSKPKYRKVLLKLSGESLLPPDSKYGISIDTAQWLAREIIEVVRKGVSLAVVIGGGNIFRGVTAENAGMDRVRADYMGMLATVINGLALLEVFEHAGLSAELMSAKEVQGMAQLYTPALAQQKWSEHQISQSQYYQWRDQFFANASKAFEVHEQTQKETRLERENERLKRVVGELTLELKKSEEVLG